MKVVNIDDKRPHKTSMVICLKCYKRWVAARPIYCKLIDLECPNCSVQGFVIETGEHIN